VFALELLVSNQWQTCAIDLLVGNFETGDLPTINAALINSDDSNSRHRITMAIKDLYQNQQPIGIDETLLLVYEHGPCGFCRYQAVKWLMEINALPDWIKQECRFDANSEIRELVAADSE
jgi:hypothetical protein